MRDRRGPERSGSAAATTARSDGGTDRTRAALGTRRTSTRPVRWRRGDGTWWVAVRHRQPAADQRQVLRHHCVSLVRFLIIVVVSC